ncbi:hypothetical protein LTR17_018364 [Elasticomyces elasticus]|nr:hypothetical protein LTR17_018364 [Elasticomyces elasticus]
MQTLDTTLYPPSRPGHCAMLYPPDWDGHKIGGVLLADLAQLPPDESAASAVQSSQQNQLPEPMNMLPSIRFIDDFAAINDNERSRDDSTQLAPVRSVEQPTARFYDDVRRNSVIQIPPVRYEKRNANTAYVGDSHDIIFQKMLNEHHDA